MSITVVVITWENFSRGGNFWDFIGKCLGLAYCEFWLKLKSVGSKGMKLNLKHFL